MRRFIPMLLALIASIVPVAAGPNPADTATDDTPTVQTVTVTIPGEEIPVTFIVNTDPLCRPDADVVCAWFVRHPQLSAEDKNFLAFAFPVIVNAGIVDARDGNGRLVLDQDSKHYIHMAQVYLAAVNTRLKGRTKTRVITFTVPVQTKTVTTTIKTTCYVPCGTYTPCVPLSFAKGAYIPTEKPTTVYMPGMMISAGVGVLGVGISCKATPGTQATPLLGCTPNAPPGDINPGTGQLTTPQVPHGVGIYR